MVTRPDTPPNSSMTIAAWSPRYCISFSRSETRLVSDTTKAGLEQAGDQV
jgi:hypothetical protein